MGGLPQPVLQALLIVAGFACCVAMSMPQVHIVAYCLDLGIDSGRGAEMLSLMLATGIVSRLAFGAIADRIGPFKTLLVASGLQTLALLLLAPVLAAPVGRARARSSLFCPSLWSSRAVRAHPTPPSGFSHLK